MTEAIVGHRPGPQAKPNARKANSALFLVNGAGFGIWAALLPTLQYRLGITNAETSRPLLGMVFGAFLAMPLMGKMISRWGTPRCLQVVAPAYAALLPLLILAPSLAWTSVAAFLFGALKGSLDVGINSQAVVVEGQWGRPIIGSFQALWSAGGFLAALAVSSALQAGWSPAALTLTASAVLTTVATLMPRHLIQEARQEATDPTAARRISPQLWRVGSLAFLAFFSEGALMDWSAIYTRKVAGADAWLAPLAYGIFCCSMALGRFLGDDARGRYGMERILQASGLMTTAGLALIICWPVWPAVFVGLVFAGFGLSNLVPIFLSAASRGHNLGVGRAVSIVSTIGYLGFMIGPPAIGGLSEWIGLRGAFVLVVGFAAVIGAYGPRMVNTRQPPLPASPPRGDASVTPALPKL